MTALCIFGDAQGVPAKRQRAGSVRAFRALRFNEGYAAKLGKKKQHEASLKKPEKQTKSASNPFIAGNVSNIRLRHLTKAPL